MHRKKFGNTAKLIRTERFSTALREIADRNFLLLTLINFFVMLTYYLQFVISADYARSAYGLDLGMAGLSAGIIVLGCLLGRFASGNFVSTLGCRLMLFIGLSGYALSMAAFFCIHSSSWAYSPALPQRRWAQSLPALFQPDTRVWE